MIATVLRWALGFVVPQQFLGAAVAGAMFALATTAAGGLYLKGRGDGSAACESRYQRIALQLSHQETDDLEAWAKQQVQLAEERAKQEAKNDEAETDIDGATSALPDCPGALSAEWLRQLGRLE